MGLIHAVKEEAHHLHEIETEGKEGATPFIAILEVALFLLPIVLLVGGLTFAAYYLIG